MSRTSVVLLVAVALTLAVAVIDIQSQTLSITPAGLLSACGLSAANELKFCNVANDPANPAGGYLSANGAAYFRISSTTTGGVSSWGGRTGVVVPATGDYSFVQLANPPTKIHCNVASLSAGATGAFDASTCTLTP